MAAIDFIVRAGSDMEEAILALTQTLEMVDQVAGDDRCPPWLFVIHGLARTVHDNAQAYMQAVHVHAKPVLLDLDRATKGGLGR